MTNTPLLFLDVDGPLIPFGAASYPAAPGEDTNPLLARLNPGHGPRLAALPCELVWATTWMDEADDSVAPRLGLPKLAVATWLEPTKEDEWHGLHWKTRGLVAWAAGRPFVWVDDEITSADREWVAANHRGEALLHRVDARLGLTDADFDVLDDWLRTRWG